MIRAQAILTAPVGKCGDHALTNRPLTMHQTVWSITVFSHRMSKALQAFTSGQLAMLLVAMLAGLILISAPASAQERGVFKEGESAEDIAEDAQTDQLDFVFRQIASATNDGLENLIPILNGLLATLLIISLVLTFLFGAFQEDFSPFVTLLKNAVVVGFILFFIDQWDFLRAVLLSGAGQIGLIAGNSDLNANSVLNPAGIAGRGFGLGLAVLARIADLSGPIAFFDNLNLILVYLIAAFIILAAFLILAIVVFVALVEFYVGTTIAVILFPLGVLRATSFAAQSAFGYVIASAVKIAILGLIIGLASSIFIDPLLDREPDPLAGEAFGIAFICLAIAIVSWSASSVAAGLVQGGPALGASAAIGPAVSAAVGGALAARAVSMGGAAAGRALGSLGGGGSASGGGSAGRLPGPPDLPRLPGPGSSPPLLSGPGSQPALPNPRPGTDPAAPGGEGFSLSGAPYNAPLPTTPTSSSSTAVSPSGDAYHTPLPVPAGQSLPVSKASSSGVGGGSSATGAGAAGSRGASGAIGLSSARPYVAKPALPPAGEGRGGRGGVGWRGAATYAGTNAILQERGGGGYRGPDLERD